MIYALVAVINFALLIMTHVFISNFFFETNIVSNDCMASTKSNFEFFSGFIYVAVICLVAFLKEEEYIVFNIVCLTCLTLW